MSFISILLVATIVLNLTLGFFVFLGKAKSAANRYYFVLVIFLSIWILTNFLVVFVKTQDQAWLLSTVAYVSILGIACGFTAFCYHFPQKTFTISPLIGSLTLLGLGLVGALIFVPGLVIESIVISPWNINPGPGLGVLFLAFIIMMISAFTMLIRRLGNPTLTDSEKAQVRLVLIGTIVTTILGSICNLVIPFVFRNYDYVRVGPIFTLIMVACIAVAIVRYHLFDIKVIAVQTVTVVLCVSLFFRTIFTSTLHEQLINIGLLIPTIVVCIFLVRSVLREVEQREALAIANAGQQNLIHIMNHQIKGRLGAGKSIFAELLEGEYGAIPVSATVLMRKGLQEMDTGVSYIQTILNGMSAENGTLPYDMQPINFKDIVINAAVKEKDKAMKKGLSLDVQTGGGLLLYRWRRYATRRSRAKPHRQLNQIHAERWGANCTGA